MKLDELIEAKRAEVTGFKETYDRANARIRGILKTAADEQRDKLTGLEAEEVANLRTEASTAEKRYDAEKKQLNELERAGADEEIQERIAETVHDTAAAIPAQRQPVPDTAGAIAAQGGARRAYDQVHRVAGEERTYHHGSDRNGEQFLRDVSRNFLFGDIESRERLARHMQEERVERGGTLDTRAVGTGAFSGLTIPQYLTDLFAPQAKAGRPFADICRHHDLPEDGMTVNIGRMTTGTSSDTQASENSAVSETDADDTLLTVNVQTNSGQQTMSRQAVERSTGALDITMEDLYRAHDTALDNKLLNQATNGLTNVATAITYTDASPTGPELYPKFQAALSGTEAALLDQATADSLVTIMHSRRWRWLQSQLTTSWPMIGQPGLAPQLAGQNLREVYGSGFRGVLPDGSVVIVDNNITTTAGAGTEDEIYTGSRNEWHLWEDPNAPMLIRAEQTKAATLGVLLVVYSYFAYTHVRYAHTYKISGTGLIAPTF